MKRGLLRLPGLLGLLAGLLRTPVKKGRADLWLQAAARRCAVFFDLRVEIEGNLPCEGLLVANHLGYLDVIALASAFPCRFVAKNEVAGWPVFGALATRGRTIYVDRTARRDVRRAGEEIAAALREGPPLVLFPEGTSSDGSQVLPFRSSLLEPALQSGCPITPVYVSYAMPEGSVEREIAYWGEMTLLRHLINLLGHRQLVARIHCGEPQVLDLDRKSAARYLHRQVVELSWLSEPAILLPPPVSAL